MFVSQIRNLQKKKYAEETNVLRNTSDAEAGTWQICGTKAAAKTAIIETALRET